MRGWKYMDQTRISDYDSDIERDSSEDWTFAGADTKYFTHGLHPYPARMIPQIVARLLSSYSEENDIIWDPFCGSGSTLVESMLYHRKSIGTDLNPFAIFLSRVKTTPISPIKLRKTKGDLIDNIHKIRRKDVSLQPPEMPNIDYWFSPAVQSDLSLIREAIDSIESQDTRNFFLLCLASTVRDVSFLKKREFKIVRMSKKKMKSFNPDVLTSFLSHIDRCIPLMDGFVRNLPKSYHKPEIIEIDNRDTPIENGSVDSIITSPPYGDHSTTVAYGQFSRYPALWVGLDLHDIKTVDKRGLGGRAKRVYEENILASNTLDLTYSAISKRSPKRAKDFYNFFFELNESLLEMYRKLRRNSVACIVVGNRSMSRIRIPTNLIIVELGDEIGFSHEMTIGRDIPQKRMPWQNAPENIEGISADTMHTENIVILRKN
ncbi:MAG: LexA repressor [Candidatus Thorarchaeota archaeon]|nr:MAG: LexA repressor [Candidatus Thorarchaeota archaeon]